MKTLVMKYEMCVNKEKSM